MQTFLPFADYAESARALDYRRLGKQRVEGMQLIKSISFGLIEPPQPYGWRKHPAFKYWCNENGVFLPALIEYTQTMIDEWIRRGYKNTMSVSFYNTIEEAYPDKVVTSRPVFSEAMHESHRCRLAQKDPDHYLNEFVLPADWESREYVWEAGRLANP